MYMNIYLLHVCAEVEVHDNDESAVNESQTEENGNETQEGDVPAQEGDVPKTEGDVPAQEGDVPAPEGDVPTPEKDGPAEEGGSPDNDSMEVGDNNSQSVDDEKKDKRERDMFRLVVVNSYGSQDVRKLVDDPNKMLQLSGEASYVCFCTHLSAYLQCGML